MPKDLDINVEEYQEIAIETQDSQSQRAIEKLANLNRLSELSIINTCITAERMTWRLPLLRNLQKLVFRGIERYLDPKDPDGNIRDIGEIILHSPHLKYLGLTAARDGIWFNASLKELSDFFHEERIKRDLNPLKLATLHLGIGFLPRQMFENVPVPDNAAKLTDLTALETLRIDNWHIVPGSHSDAPDTTFEPSQFYVATNLRRISVERLTPDAAALIRKCFESQESPRLTEIEVTRYFETEPSKRNPYEVDSGRGHRYSVPLESIGLFHWRKIHIGMEIHDCIKTVEPLLKNFVAKCTELEELAVTMEREHLDNFCSEILPSLGNLKVLLITGSSSMIDKSIDEWVDENEYEYEQRMLGIALKVFEGNRSTREKDPKSPLLRYVGLGVNVYSCMLVVPPTPISDNEFEVSSLNMEGASQRYRVSKLSMEESFSFKQLEELRHEFWL